MQIQAFVNLSNRDISYKHYRLRCVILAYWMTPSDNPVKNALYGSHIINDNKLGSASYMHKMSYFL